jgi:hypothetical protein
MVSRRCKRRLVSGLSVGGSALGVAWGGGGSGGAGAHAPRPARSARGVQLRTGAPPRRTCGRVRSYEERERLVCITKLDAQGKIIVIEWAHTTYLTSYGRSP